MTYTAVGIRQPCSCIGEDLAHLAHTYTGSDPAITEIDRHSRALLSTVLQRGECQRKIASDIDALAAHSRKNTDYAACIVQTLHGIPLFRFPSAKTLDLFGFPKYNPGSA